VADAAVGDAEVVGATVGDAEVADATGADAGPLGGDADAEVVGALGFGSL